MGDAVVTTIVGLSDMGSGTYLPAPEPWPADLTAYDGWLRSSGLPRSTRRMRNYQMRAFANEIQKAPFDVDLNDIVGYLSRPTWAPNTKAANRSAIRSFYKWAKQSGRIKRNPAKSVPTVHVPKGKPHPAPLSAIERALELADPRVVLLVTIAYKTGLRCCELAAVHPRDVEPRGERWALRVVGKGSKVRIVPLSADLAAEIQSYAGYLFPGRIDGHLSPAYVSRIVSRALPPGVTAHALRHYFATTALRRIKDARVVQELLGHASLATTQVYTEVHEDDMWEAADAA